MFGESRIVANEAFPAAERRHLPGTKGIIRYFTLGTLLQGT